MNMIAIETAVGIISMAIVLAAALEATITSVASVDDVAVAALTAYKFSNKHSIKGSDF